MIHSSQQNTESRKMSNLSTAEKSRKAEKKAFIRRAKYALKVRSFKLALSVANDVAKYHFAKFLVVDSHGTRQFCWTLSEAYTWLPFCAAGHARIVDTLDFSIVASRSYSYA